MSTLYVVGIGYASGQGFPRIHELADRIRGAVPAGNGSCAARPTPFGQKTQTHYFPRAYTLTVTHPSSCIPPRFTPYSPPTRGNQGGGLTHGVEATAGLYHGLRR